MRTPGLMELCSAIESTSISNWIQSDSGWFSPAIQSIHILSISAILIAAAMINLRILGIASSDHSLYFVCRRFSPIILMSLVLLLISGLLMIIGEPARSLANSAFQFKMLCLIGNLIILWVISKGLSQDEQYWQRSASRKVNSIALAIISMILWISIVFAGRWIAYL
jgi:putative copper export protein